MTAVDVDALDKLREAATPIKGRCGTCDWPTDRLPCPYCAAVTRTRAAALRASNGEGATT